ncbi:lactococcin 972 family bacteriocin [Holzapfeliella sp. JNUCC 80]
MNFKKSVTKALLVATIATGVGTASNVVDAQSVQGGTWTYGSNNNFLGGLRAFSNYHHPYTYHMSSVVSPYTQKSDYKYAGPQATSSAYISTGFGEYVDFDFDSNTAD